MNTHLLEKLGMTPKEVRLYLKLLELGSSPAHPLAQRLDENRTTTYSLLQSMQEKGFITYLVKKNVKYFSAMNPSVLINHFFNDAQYLKKLLPELLALTSALPKKPKISFYEGVEGIKQIGEILLEVPGSTRYSFMGAGSSDGTMHPEVKRYYEEDFVNRRIALGIHYKGIVTGKLPMATRYAHTDKAHLRELRYLDPKKFPITIHIDIFPNNKVALYSYSKNDQMGVIIEHEAFYTTMRTVFELAWAGAKRMRLESHPRR
jgi:sugar-specific transcriptional regulator TrmB